MVTPFAWSQPHPVNEHVQAASEELRRRGHEVVVLAPSNRAVDLAQGRRALRRLSAQGEPLEGVVALGPAVPVSRKSRAPWRVGRMLAPHAALYRPHLRRPPYNERDSECQLP